MIFTMCGAINTRLRCLPVASLRIPLRISFSMFNCAERWVTFSSFAAWLAVIAGYANSCPLSEVGAPTIELTGTHHDSSSTIEVIDQNEPARLAIVQRLPGGRTRSNRSTCPTDSQPEEDGNSHSGSVQSRRINITTVPGEPPLYTARG